ncbi:MAG TPA: DUF362 domain-containing protein [Phycisphaerae bacterium]|nr:DUF362 domain-containing protein [Phycisphaerae bacterium]
MSAARVALSPLPHEKETEEELRSAVTTALTHFGGIEAFVQPGKSVLLKPNQTLFMPHKSGSTTSPPLIRVLIDLCREAGARDIWVAEAAGHAQSSRSVMANTGLVHGVNDTPARVIYLDEIAERLFDFGEDAGELRTMPAPEIMERADVIINVPKAKTHFVDPVSCACKNWVGVMPMSYRLYLQRLGEAYYKGTALLLRKFKPTLNVVDGAWAGEGQGPGSNDAFWWGWIMASPDPVATDVTLARLFGLDHTNIRMANEAAAIGVGTRDPEQITLEGAKFEDAARKVQPADPSVERFPCRVLVGKGVNIEGTVGHWKTIADGWLKVGLWKLFTLKGKPTFMFGAIEDPDFEAHLDEGPYVVLDDTALDKYKYDPRVTFVPGYPVPQSYMQHEMVHGMGFGGIYQTGLSVEKMIASFKGKMTAKG